MSKNQMTTVDKLIESKKERDHINALTKEQETELRKAMSRVASSKSGEFMLKTLINYLGVFKVQNTKDGIDLIKQNEKRNVYLEFFRPYIPNEIRKELEK